MKITDKDVLDVVAHLKETGVMAYQCSCGAFPRMVVDGTAWGAPITFLKCQSCDFEVAGTGKTHIEAAMNAVELWDERVLEMHGDGLVVMPGQGNATPAA